MYAASRGDSDRLVLSRPHEVAHDAVVAAPCTRRCRCEYVCHQCCLTLRWCDRLCASLCCQSETPDQMDESAETRFGSSMEKLEPLPGRRVVGFDDNSTVVSHPLGRSSKARPSCKRCAIPTLTPSSRAGHAR